MRSLEMLKKKLWTSYILESLTPCLQLIDGQMYELDQAAKSRDTYEGEEVIGSFEYQDQYPRY